MLKEIGKVVDGQSAKRIKDLLQKVRSSSYQKYASANNLTSTTPTQATCQMEHLIRLMIRLDHLSDPVHLLPSDHWKR